MFLDLRHEECPIPTVKTVDALKKLRRTAPEEVTVVLDDAACAADIPYQAGRLGYVSETKVTGDSEWTIRLVPTQRAAGPAQRGNV